MKKKAPFYIMLIYIIWALVLVVAILVTINSKEISRCRYYDVKVSAANHFEKCANAIKDYKISHDITIPKEDINETGLIGLRASFITTSSGQLQAKRTTTNPDFAAIAIDMFKELHLKEGDEVGVMMSGSFPALNIAVLCAIEEFKLKPCIMASIGASTYGANIPEFNIYDMIVYLNSIGLLHTGINYVSLGGSDECGGNFSDVTGHLTDEEEKELFDTIVARISSGSSKFIYEKDYVKNVNLRMSYFKQDVSNIKLFINIGGNVSSIGVDDAGFISQNGLITNKQVKPSSIKITDRTGLIERFLKENIPVAQFLNIKGLAYSYNIPYDHVGKITIGESDVYNEVDYNLQISILALALSVGFLVLIIIFRKKKIYNI